MLKNKLNNMKVINQKLMKENILVGQFYFKKIKQL